MATLGPYQLGERLGAGGMGTVYRALPLRGGPPVALKLLPRDEITDPNLRARFERESRALAELRHPHVIQVIGSGIDNGQPWIAMELVEGASLAQLLQRGPLTPGEAVELVEPLCEALTYVHGRGLLHRDLKPANVLLRRGAPVLTDFGLARRLDQSQRLTQTGEILGTPGYLAPEQCGLGVEPTPALDVYGLGALLYALLTRRPPCAGATVVHTLQRVLEEPPLPPSQAAPGRVDPTLDAIVLRALAKHPTERYPDPAALGEALRAWRAGGARPADRGGRLPRGLALGSLALALALALGVGIGFREGAPQTRPAQADPAQADPDSPDPASPDPASPDPASPDPGSPDPASPRRPQLAATAPRAPALPRPSSAPRAPEPLPPSLRRRLDAFLDLRAPGRRPDPQVVNQAHLHLLELAEELRARPDSPLLNATYGHLLRVGSRGLTALPYLQRGRGAALSRAQRVTLLRDLIASLCETGDFEAAIGVQEAVEPLIDDPTTRATLRCSRAALIVYDRPRRALELLSAIQGSLPRFYRAQALLSLARAGAPEGLAEVPRLVSSPERLSPMLRACALASLGDYHRQLGQLERAADFYRRSRAVGSNPNALLGELQLRLARERPRDLPRQLQPLLSDPGSRELIGPLVEALRAAGIPPAATLVQSLPGLVSEHAFALARRIRASCPEDLGARLAPLRVAHGAFRLNQLKSGDAYRAAAWFWLGEEESARLLAGGLPSAERAKVHGLFGQLHVAWAEWVHDHPRRLLPGRAPQTIPALERGIEHLLQAERATYLIELARALRALGRFDPVRARRYTSPVLTKLARRRRARGEELEVLVAEAITRSRLALIDRAWLASLERNVERADLPDQSLRAALMSSTLSLATREGAPGLTPRVRYHAQKLLEVELDVEQRNLVYSCLRSAAILEGKPREALAFGKRALELTLAAGDPKACAGNLVQVVRIGAFLEIHAEVDAYLRAQEEKLAPGADRLRAQFVYQRGLLWRSVRPELTLELGRRYEQLRPGHFRGPLLRALAHKQLGQRAAFERAEAEVRARAPSRRLELLELMLEE